MDGFQVGKKIRHLTINLLINSYSKPYFSEINTVFTLHGTAFWGNSVTITYVVKSSWSTATSQNQVSSHSFEFSHLER